MRAFMALFAFALSLFFSATSFAQSAGKVDELVTTHHSVGTAAAAAIPAASVKDQLVGWELCADSTNTNTVSVGNAADPTTDGRMLAAKECLRCPGCVATTLKGLHAKGGAASQGYSVFQYRTP
jgi:hypothetical protein